MHIEPSLESSIDARVKIALATFGRNEEEQVLRDAALGTFAGLGLARTIIQNGELTWVKTDRLKELEKGPTAPVDLSKLMTPVAEGPDELTITGSLKLIIEDFIATEREQGPETACNVNEVLVRLAGQGLATLIPTDTDWIWAAEPTLIDHYKMGKKGIREFGILGKPKIRMDETLKSIMKPMMELLELQFELEPGTKLARKARRESTIVVLLAQELQGDAIAYKDDKGRLAWKASDNLVYHENEM
jgi:hypothetical protein